MRITGDEDATVFEQALEAPASVGQRAVPDAAAGAQAIVNNYIEAS